MKLYLSFASIQPCIGCTLEQVVALFLPCIFHSAMISMECQLPSTVSLDVVYCMSQKASVRKCFGSREYSVISGADHSDDASDCLDFGILLISPQEFSAPSGSSNIVASSIHMVRASSLIASKGQFQYGAEEHLLCHKLCVCRFRCLPHVSLLQGGPLLRVGLSESWL